MLSTLVAQQCYKLYNMYTVNMDKGAIVLETTIRQALVAAGLVESPEGSDVTGFRIWMRGDDGARVVYANPVKPTDAGMQQLYTGWQGTLRAALGDGWSVEGYDDCVLIRARPSFA